MHITVAAQTARGEFGRYTDEWRERERSLARNEAPERMKGFGTACKRTRNAWANACVERQRRWFSFAPAEPA